MRKNPIALATLFCLGVAGCSQVPHIVTEYRIDVQQGNVLTQDMVAQLRPGQTKDQVRFILGSPMLTDIFHGERWDYVYQFRRRSTNEVKTRQFSVFFNQDGKLERVSGDVDEASVAELTTPVARTQVVDLGSVQAGEKPLPSTEEQPGFFHRMWSWFGF
jgi:outer membrane protein assembly factor BamE